MRKELEYLSNDIDRIDYDNIYTAISDLQKIMRKIVALLDIALPLDRSDDV